MKLLLPSLYLLSALVFPAYAGQNAKIVLDDGSTLYGEVLSFDGKTYSIESPTLGTLRVPVQQVQSLQVGAAAATTTDTDSNAALLGQVQGMQKQLMGNSQAMGKIMALQSNPAIQEILGDEDLMRAINSGDLTRLLNDPRLQRLMQDPRVQAIQQMLAP